MYVVSYSDGGDDEANEAKRELYAPFRREFPDTAVRSSPKQKPKHKKDATASDHNRSHKNKGSKHSSLLCKHRNGVVSSHARMSFAGEVLEGDRHGDNYFASKQGKTSSSAHPRQLGLPLMPTESSSSETISILSDTVFCVGQNSADANAATAAAAATASPEEIQAFSAILDHMMKEGGAEDAKKKKNNNNNKKKKDKKKKKKKKKNTPFAMFRGKALVDTPPTHQDVPQDHDRQPQQQPQKQKGFNYRKYTSNSTIDPSSFAKYLSSDEDDSLDESGVFDETITTDKNYKKKEDFRMSDRCDSDSLSIGLADDRYASTFEQTTVLGDTTFEQTVLEGAATYEQTYVEDKAKRAEKINDDDNETRDWYVPDGTTIGGTYTNANNTLGGSTAYNNPPRLNLPSIDFDESLLQYHTTTFEGTEATYDDETDRVFSCDDSTENSDSESDESSNSGSYTDYTRNGGTSLFSESTYSTVASGDISSERNTSSTKNNKKNNKPDQKKE
ncbi:unnamed protein product [Pseudo-nitzschia multistriata]|uniref:Uncharacterized protein n=1 Tax=Pseudo-nitzschia multistriata TaxID=183589 RepID=A0A448ZT29_9STRA|nr:unnamed protein product [Pseudo-nitzschia multistriata]